MQDIFLIIVTLIFLFLSLPFLIKLEKKQTDYYFDRLDKIINKNK